MTRIKSTDLSVSSVALFVDDGARCEGYDAIAAKPPTSEQSCFIITVARNLYRDELITLLARSDPGSIERLYRVYAIYSRVTGK